MHGKKQVLTKAGCLQGKARVLSADDDAKAAALQWASEAAFGSTEVAAPKILGDIVESLVGAVYIDTNHDFDKTWQVGLLPAAAPSSRHEPSTLRALSQ